MQTNQATYRLDDLRQIGVTGGALRLLRFRLGEDVVPIDALPKPIQNKLALLSGSAASVDRLSGLVARHSRQVAILAAEIGREMPGLGPDRAVDIAQAATWLGLVAGDPLDLGFPDRASLLHTATLAIQQAGLNSLKVSSPEWLRKRITAWRKTGWRSLVSGKFGKRNACKATGEAVVVLQALYADPRRFSVAECHRMYMALRETTHEWLPSMSESAVRSHLAKAEVRVAALRTRHSDKEFRDANDPVTRRLRPSHPDDLWVLDGTPFELYDRDGKRLYWVWVLDANSWRVLGYAIGETETGHLVRQSLRMATRNTGSLPHQLQFDNGSAYKAAETMDWMRNLGRLTPTAVGNARAKIAEPFWAHFERSILKFYPNHSGGNIRAKRFETLANEDYIKANRHLFPTREALIAQIHAAVALWNASTFAGRVPDAAYALGSPRRRELGLEQMQRLFWVKRPKTLKLTNRGLTMDVDKQELWYEAPAGGTADEVAEFYMDHIGEQFAVMYDPDDLETIALYDKAGRFVAHAAQPKKVPMALVDMDTDGGEALAHRQGIRKAVRRIADERAVTPARAEEVLKGAISHVRLHKDAHNAAEATLKRMAAMGVIEEPVPVPVPRAEAQGVNFGGKATLKKLEEYDEF